MPVNKVTAFHGTAETVAFDITTFQRYLDGSVVDVQMMGAPVAARDSSYRTTEPPQFLVVITHTEN